MYHALFIISFFIKGNYFDMKKQNETPIPKSKFCIRKEPALSRRRNFRWKQQGLFLFTQKFLLASLTAWLFPMALAVPYGRKSLRSVCLWFVPLLSPAAPRRLPESPFFVTHYSLVSPPFPPRISQEKKLSYLRKEIARRESRLSVLPSLSNTNKEVRKCCAVSKRLSIWSSRKIRIRRSPYIPSVCGVRKAR